MLVYIGKNKQARMKRKKLILQIVLGLFTAFILFLFLHKWNTNIYMELTGPKDCNRIDLKMEIGEKVVFNDTLSIQLFNFPQHIKYPLRIGYHDITVTSNKIGLHEKRRIFLMFNQFIATNYHGISKLHNEPSFIIWTGNNPFRYE
jgi:hypothetical protein